MVISRDENLTELVIGQSGVGAWCEQKVKGKASGFI